MSKIICTVTDSPIDLEGSFQGGHDIGNGAEIYFIGAVRSVNHGKKVVAVAYDAFVPLAIRVLNQISLEAHEKWGSDLSIWIVHRTGRLEVGEKSIVIRIGSKHRDEAYQASRYIIEQIKIRAPIWKKEFYENGETEWLKGHALCQLNMSHTQDALEH